MKLLLDTRSFLYWTCKDIRLPKRALDAIADPGNDVLVSAVTSWEVALKRAKGRLMTSFDSVAAECARRGFALLAIAPTHAERAVALPPHHSDPFDRLILAQAELERAVLVAGDKAFAAYGLPLLWR